MSTPIRAEVIVLGGGIVGAAAAEALARRGRDVLLVEQFVPGHDRGSSHGDGRIIRYTYPEAVYLHLAKLAYAAWARLETDSGETLVETTGSWECGPAGSADLEGLAANFRRFDLPHERLRAAESNRRFSCLHLADGLEALYQPDGGIVRAERSVLALWRLAEAAGARLATGERVEGIEARGEQLHLQCRSGRRFEGERLVVTAGGWAGGLLSGLGLKLPLKVSDELVAYFPVREAGPSHAVGSMPTVIEHHGGPHFYALPQIEVPGVKVGWHHTGPPADPDHREAPGGRRLRAIQDYVRQRFPYLRAEPLSTAACLYTTTPDQHFVLDRHPELPQVAIGAGFSGHGFKFGPVLGEILARLAIGEAAPVSLELFRLGRFRAEAEDVVGTAAKN